MAISVDWPTKVISVLKADTTLVDIGPPEVRSLDIEDLWLALRALEDDEDGMSFDATCETIPPLTIAGVTLARVFEIINSYTVEFEDLQYSVNIIGGNSNIGDVKVQNQVSVNTANSAGLVTGLDAVVETINSVDFDVIKTLRTMLDAIAVGNVVPPGALPGTLNIKDGDNTKNRVTATVAADGTRTVTALDPD